MTFVMILIHIPHTHFNMPHSHLHTPHIADITTISANPGRGAHNYGGHTGLVSGGPLWGNGQWEDYTGPSVPL